MDHPEARPDGGAVLQHQNESRGETTPSETDSSEADSPSNRSGPTVEYAGSVPRTGDSILFEADVPPDWDVQQYRWDFGNSATVVGKTATCIYGSGGEKSVALTLTDASGETTTVERSVTVYHDVEPIVGLADGELVSVTIRRDDEFDPTETVAVESLRLGTQTAIAMGSGASPVRSETSAGDLRVWFPADETGFEDESVGRLAGQTTDGVPLVGTVDATLFE